MATVADLVLKRRAYILLYCVLKDVMLLGGLWFPFTAATNNESQNVVIITNSLCIDS